MPLTNSEFQLILNDGSKRIEGDLAWQEDEDHSPSAEFRAEVQSRTGWPLFVRGSLGRRFWRGAPALSSRPSASRCVLCVEFWTFRRPLGVPIADGRPVARRRRRAGEARSNRKPRASWRAAWEIVGDGSCG